MTKFQVTLNFTFEPHGLEEEWDEEDTPKQEAFARTDAYYEQNSIMEYVKTNDAYSFVEYIVCDGQVESAEWDKEKFAIHMVVETDQAPEELEDDLRTHSLEDGEYEACGDTGWIVMTRGSNGEIYEYPMDIRKFWEYGLTDYRENPIEIKKMAD